MHGDLTIPQENLIFDYRLVRGMPCEVEARVEKLIKLSKGWQPKGMPTLMTIDGCNIIVQCMVKLNDK